jgi:hypothetical protein
MRNRKVFYYTLCIWLTPVLLAPLLFLVLYPLYHNTQWAFSLYILQVAIGLLFSFPVWFVLYKFTVWIQKKIQHAGLQKLYILLVGLALVLLCVLNLVQEENSMHYSFLEYALPYTGVFVLSVLFYGYPAPPKGIPPRHLKGRHIRLKVTEYDPPLAGVIVSDLNISVLTIRLHRSVTGRLVTSDLLELHPLENEQLFSPLLYNQQVQVEGYLLNGADTEFYCTGKVELDYTLN